MAAQNDNPLKPFFDWLLRIKASQWALFLTIIGLYFTFIALHNTTSTNIKEASDKHSVKADTLILQGNYIH